MDIYITGYTEQLVHSITVRDATTPTGNAIPTTATNTTAI